MIVKKLIRNTFPNLYKKLGVFKYTLIVKKFQKKYPHTKIFFSDEKRRLYSQCNQDYIVYNNFFKNKKDGIFCDVGGNHPLNINNTRYFEELGWSGYVFEPLPYMKPLWEKHRKTKFFPFSVSDKNDTLTFSILKDATGWEDMLSFVKETRNEDYGYETEETTIKVRPLGEVFKEENITYIDYMSIDVEGHELNVLKGIDFEKVRINVLTIENNPPQNPIFGNEEIRKIMFNNDYILWGRIMGLDDIYVHRDFLNE